MEETLTELEECRATGPTAFALTVQVLSCLVVFITIMWVAFGPTVCPKIGFVLVPVQACRFMSQYGTLALGIVLAANAVIYGLLFRFSKKAVAYPSCAFVILCQAVIVALSGSH